MENRRKVLCLLGPTGAGKTEAALALADAFGGAVVNFDSRQVYREIPLVTAQPTPAEQVRCPHHLYGFLSCDQVVSAGRYAEMAAEVVRDLAERGLVPILVGGTGLYLRALLEGLAPIPDVSGEVREKVFADWDAFGGEAMHERLTGIDPVYAARVHHNDRQRVTRALEVFEGTGRTFTQWHAQAVSPLGMPCLKLGVGMDRKLLEGRLARRIDAMLAAGAMEEISRALKSCGSREAPGMSGIGCAELAAHLAGEMSLENAKAQWLANTKAYAKRQMTWFRREPGVHWFKPAETDGMVRLSAEWLHGEDIQGTRESGE